MSGIDPVEFDEMALLAKKRLEEEKLLHQVDKGREALQLNTGNRLDEDTLALSNEIDNVQKDPLALPKEASSSTLTDKTKAALHSDPLKEAGEISEMSLLIGSYVQDGKKLFTPFNNASENFQKAIDRYLQAVWPDKEMKAQDSAMQETARLAIKSFQSKTTSKEELQGTLQNYNRLAEARNIALRPALDALTLAVADYNGAIRELNEKIQQFNLKWQSFGFSKLPQIELVRGPVAFTLFNLSAWPAKMQMLPFSPPALVNPAWTFLRGGMIENYLRAYQNLMAPMTPILRQAELSFAESILARYFSNESRQGLKSSSILEYDSAFFKKAAGCSFLTNISSPSFILGLESKFLERVFARRIFDALNFEFGRAFSDGDIERLKAYIFKLLGEASLLAALPAYKLASKSLPVNELYSASYTLCKTISLSSTLVDLISTDALPLAIPFLLDSKYARGPFEKKQREGSQDENNQDEKDEDSLPGHQLAKNGITLTLLAIALYEISLSLGLPSFIPALLQSTVELKQAHLDSRPADGFILDLALENLRTQLQTKRYLANHFLEMGMDEPIASEKASFAINSLVSQLPFKNSESMFKTLAAILKELNLDEQNSIQTASQVMGFLEIMDMEPKEPQIEAASWRVDLAEERIVSLLIKAGLDPNQAFKIAEDALMHLPSITPGSDFQQELQKSLLKAGLGRQEALWISEKIQPVFEKKATLNDLTLAALKVKISKEIDLFTAAQMGAAQSLEIKEALMDLLFGQIINGKRSTEKSIVFLLKKNIEELQKSCQNTAAKEKILSIFYELTSPQLDLGLLHARLMGPIDTLISSFKQNLQIQDF